MKRIGRTSNAGKKRKLPKRIKARKKRKKAKKLKKRAKKKVKMPPSKTSLKNLTTNIRIKCEP